eukprot:CAMPEP_0179970476 /NCGR_PEP_ID=MMETSP0983-20121128/35313_1 /TAXON_ID=483367 /ORGANISM="non described non described, Strain CCMP 2436" /LENGTH=43 /DNA_ID= /DNA_START= /DNA_END= /DNA_ORIENTATION=
MSTFTARRGAAAATVVTRKRGAPLAFAAVTRASAPPMASAGAA